VFELETEAFSWEKTTAYPIAHLFHLSLVGSSHGTLVITQDGNFPVAVIVELDLLLNTNVCSLELLQQSRHCERRVVGTEDFRTQTGHVVREVLVELPRLFKLAYNKDKEQP
jgi:hypothetical protein